MHQHHLESHPGRHLSHRHATQAAPGRQRTRSGAEHAGGLRVAGPTADPYERQEVGPPQPCKNAVGLQCSDMSCVVGVCTCSEQVMPHAHSFRCVILIGRQPLLKPHIHTPRGICTRINARIQVHTCTGKNIQRGQKTDCCMLLRACYS